MDELIALIDSATGHLGGDVRGLTSAYRELQRRLRSRAHRRVRDRLFGLLPGAARLLRRGGEGVAGAPRRLSDCDDTPMLSRRRAEERGVRSAPDPEMGRAASSCVVRIRPLRIARPRETPIEHRCRPRHERATVESPCRYLLFVTGPPWRQSACGARGSRPRLITALPRAEPTVGAGLGVTQLRGNGHSAGC